MSLSAKVEYACLALLNLALRPPAGPLARAHDIAQSYDIPERYLVQILLRLKEAGLVESVRGASGGYRLTRAPARISLAQVAEAVEGSPAGGRRLTENPVAQIVRDAWRKAHEAKLRSLSETSLERLLQETHTHEWVI